MLARGHVYKLAIDSQTKTLVRCPLKLVSTAQTSAGVTRTSLSNFAEPELTSRADEAETCDSEPNLAETVFRFPDSAASVRCRGARLRVDLFRFGFWMKIWVVGYP